MKLNIIVDYQFTFLHNEYLFPPPPWRNQVKSQSIHTFLFFTNIFYIFIFRREKARSLIVNICFFSQTFMSTRGKLFLYTAV